jgi:alkylhydroperoxidase family enzyme
MKFRQYPRRVQKLVESVLHGRGHTSPALRQNIEAITAKEHGAERSNASIPSDLLPYIQKVSRHAYKVTDGDMEALRQAGYTEDQILEITLSAAMGPGLARLEKGLSLLEQAE